MKYAIKTLLPVALVMSFAVPAAATMASTTPHATHANGFSIRFVTGGATPEGRDHMHQMAPGYDLQLELQAPGGNKDYDDVYIKMTDEAGKVVLDAPAGGPLFSIQIPPGHYNVSADVGDRHVTRPVDVEPGKTSHLFFSLGS